MRQISFWWKKPYVNLFSLGLNAPFLEMKGIAQVCSAHIIVTTNSLGFWSMHTRLMNLRNLIICIQSEQGCRSWSMWLQSQLATYRRCNIFHCQTSLERDQIEQFMTNLRMKINHQFCTMSHQRLLTIHSILEAFFHSHNLEGLFGGL